MKKLARWPTSRADPRRAEADALHGSHLVPEATEVSDPDRPVGENGEGPKEVLDCPLGTERDRDAADAQAGDHTEDRTDPDTDDADAGDGESENRAGRHAVVRGRRRAELARSDGADRLGVLR